ncbi:MAG: glutathione S-transferase N-terminal domain-containing protein [Burkholderiales bacterium]|nr:glutathione S-transferase N-terminal domain-containing protein [Burkholderiales bacterium]
MKLYGSRTSPYVRKVRIVMIEKRIECDFMEENVWSTDTAVTQHNPLTKIPVLVLDDGMPLYDSRVVAEYLDGVTPVSRLIPDGGRERALVKRWEALGDGIADAGIALFLERKRDQTLQSKDWLARQRGKVDAGIAAAARELGDREYCQGLSVTLGDISLACALLWMEFRLPEVPWRADHPNLRKWIERLEAMPSFVDTTPPA